MPSEARKLVFLHQKMNRDEEAVCNLLSPVQRKMVENLIITCVNEKVVAVATLSEAADYVCKMEYARGQIDILQYLLALDETARADLKPVTQE